jgi:hypothetical protein
LPFDANICDLLGGIVTFVASYAPRIEGFALARLDVFVQYFPMTLPVRRPS